jgi:hypothetical protein
MSDAIGWEQTIYNRPAEVRSVWDTQAKVVWQDTGTLGFVLLEALEQ